MVFGINVIAVVFDDCPANITTAKHLGCKLKVDEIQPWFQHPKLPSSKVYVILDVCHMIKLLRNLLGDYKVLHTDNNGNHERIEWQYLEQLCSLQEDLGFSLANKLKRKHVLYKKHKMSVSLAAWTSCKLIWLLKTLH